MGSAFGGASLKIKIKSAVLVPYEEVFHSSACHTGGIGHILKIPTLAQVTRVFRGKLGFGMACSRAAVNCEAKGRVFLRRKRVCSVAVFCESPRLLRCSALIIVEYYLCAGNAV